MKDPLWIRWARALQAVSQTGLHWNENVYDRERYRQVAEVAAEILAEHTTLTKEEVLRLQAEEVGHATPRVDVRGVVFRDGKVLLVQELLDGGRWTLPGGWADVNETASESAVREVREESGFETRAVRLLAAYDRERQGHTPPFPYHIYRLYFLCEITGGEAKPNHETGAVAFFGEDELPELSDARTKAGQIRRFFQMFRAGELAADFD